MTDTPDRWQEWETQIRQPAEHTKEGLRALRQGPASAEYQVAPLDDDRWAIRIKCSMESSSGMSIPWRAFPTREEAVAFFQQEALAFFKREDRLKGEKEAARRRIMDLLAPNNLWGFQELEPQPEPAPQPKAEAQPEEEDDVPELPPFSTTFSPETYARIAQEKKKRGLHCMLRDARKKFKQHGRHSFSGKEARKEIAAAEAELQRRGMPIPPPGEETIAWDRKAEPDT